MKKLRLISIICALAMALSCFAAFSAVAATTPEWAESGDGSEGDPYIINTAVQFKAFYEATLESENDYLSKHYKLGANIVLNEGNAAEWGTTAPTYQWSVPVGQSTAFSGVFDGNGYAISGVYLKWAGKCGLFYQISGGAEVKNLRIVNSYIECTDYTSTYVENGSFAGRVLGTISNCYSNAILVHNNPSNKINNATGGIAGMANSTTAKISNCVFDGTITGVGRLGGILGSVNGSKSVEISNCVNLGTLKSTVSDYVGGIVGRPSGTTTLDKCLNLSTRISEKNGGTPSELVGGGSTSTALKDDTLWEIVIIRNCVVVEGLRTADKCLVSTKGSSDYPVTELTLAQLLSEDVTKDGGALAGWTYRAGSFPMPPKGEGNVDLELNLLLGLKFKGAAVRLDIATGVDSGIRFSTTIDTDMLETLKNAGATIEGYGTYITVEEAIVGKDYDFTPDVLANEGWRCLDVTATELFEGTKIAGTIASVAVNSQQYISRAYVKFTVGGVTYTHLADYDDSNVRSVSFVAEAALDDFSDEYDEEKYKYEVVVSGVTKYSPYSTEQRQYLDTLK